MNKLFFMLALCCGSLLLQPRALSAENMQYENQVVACLNIQIMGAPVGSASAIKARIKTREGDFFSQTTFDNDLKILVNDFDRIDPLLECIDGKIYITLKIWPKPQIRSLQWCGNCKLETKYLSKELGFHERALFDRRAFNQAFHKLKTYYVQQGFFEAQLSYEIHSVPECNEVDIVINIDEGRAGKIKQICFVNFTQEECNELSDMITTKRYELFTSWLTGEGTYHEEAVRQDELIILNYLQNSGYADAQVSIAVCEALEDNRIIIHIIADKGNLYYIGGLTFKGNSLFCDEEIAKRFLIEEGDLYAPELIRATATRINDLYGRYGYIDAVVNYELKLSETDCSYEVEYTVEESEQFRVGLIKVFGNCSTQTRVILNETLLVPGEIFNMDKLKLTEQRLLNIGYFKCVNVYAVKSEGPCGLGPNFRDVHIEVEETTTGHFGAFFGFSTTENVFGGFNVTETNFNYKGIPYLFEKGYPALRGGGEYAHFTATIGAKSRSYVVSWNKPFFMDTPWTVGFDIERSSNRYVSKDYDIEASGLNIHGIYRLNPFVRVGCHYRLRYTEVDLSDSDASEEMEEEVHNSGLISAVGASLIYDSTNHPLNPSQGFRSRFEFECAGIGGRHKFLSFSYLNSYFYSMPWLDSVGVWKLRGDVRFIQPYGGSTAHNIPLDERFFLGGEYAIRGYRPYKLGPRFPHSDDPRGGISLQLFSLEYSRPIFSRLEAFAFIDTGHLSDRQWHIGRFSTSIGYGVRLGIFNQAPPLTIGMGYPLNPQNRGEVKRFFMTVGGRF